MANKACKVPRSQFISYIDTIGWYCWRPLPQGMLSELRQQYGKNLHIARWLIPTGASRWTIQINQPAKATIIMLNAMQDRCCINRVDLAYDFLTPDPEQFTAFLHQTVTQKWRRRQRTVIVATTAYWRPVKAYRNIALYGDRVSKATDTPCAHLELRFKGAAARRTGNLIEIDPLALLKRQTRLLKIKTDNLDWQIEQIARNTVCSKGYPIAKTIQKAKQIIYRAMRDEEGSSSSQLLWDLGRVFRRTCFVDLEWADLIHGRGMCLVWFDAYYHRSQGTTEVRRQDEQDRLGAT